MEYFASDPRVLARINKHYKTGESLPLHVIEKLCATKKIFAAVELQAQLVFSAADQVGVYSLHLWIYLYLYEYGQDFLGLQYQLFCIFVCFQL